MRFRHATVVVMVAVLTASVLGACGADSPAPAGTSGAVSITADGHHACVVDASGAVRCWGSNMFGQLGDGSTGDATTAAVRVPGLRGVVQASAGTDFTCAVDGDGRAGCWGFNLAGQLGNGTDQNISMVPVPVRGVVDARAVAGGGNHACAARRDGRVQCWGGNEFGQLGDGSRTDSTVPVTVSGIHDAVAVTAGTGFSCAVRRGGHMACWGLNSLGQLGDGTRTDRTTPTSVPGLAGVISASSGLGTTCVVDGRLAVRCWGSGESGQLGTGTTAGRARPRTVPGVERAEQVVVGERTACAVAGDGRTWCWGGATSASPARVPGLPTIGQGSRPGPGLDATRVAVLGDQACVVGDDGDTTCHAATG